GDSAQLNRPRMPSDATDPKRVAALTCKPSNAFGSAEETELDGRHRAASRTIDQDVAAAADDVAKFFITCACSGGVAARTRRHRHPPAERRRVVEVEAVSPQADKYRLKVSRLLR